LPWIRAIFQHFCVVVEFQEQGIESDEDIRQRSFVAAQVGRISKAVATIVEAVADRVRSVVTQAYGMDVDVLDLKGLTGFDGMESAIELVAKRPQGATGSIGRRPIPSTKVCDTSVVVTVSVGHQYGGNRFRVDVSYCQAAFEVIEAQADVYD
jgi:hypothetical protein